MDFTTVTLTRMPDQRPFAVEMKEGPRKRKLAAELRYDPSLNADGMNAGDARWWLVLNENHRVGAFYYDQVETLLRDWLAKGYVIRAEVVVPA